MPADRGLGVLVQTGVAVIVATRDGGSHPQLSRARGPSFDPGYACFSVCVEAAPGSAMAQSLRIGGDLLSLTFEVHERIDEATGPA